MPQVVVIAGPNGAGKTTVSKTLLSEILQSNAFVNADAIAQGLNGLAPDTQAFQAGRLMLQKLDELAAAGEDFAFETTLSGRTYVAWLRKLREEGYQVFLFYSWLDCADLAQIIHGPDVTRSVSEGVVTVRPRLRFGLHRGSLLPPWGVHE